LARRAAKLNARTDGHLSALGRRCGRCCRGCCCCRRWQTAEGFIRVVAAVALTVAGHGSGDACAVQTLELAGLAEAASTDSCVK
jgi:hypothetical protein